MVSSEDPQSVLWEHVAMVVAMRQQELGITVVRPAMRQIMIEHVPSFRDLLDVVTDSPFVPFGHEVLFAKGLSDGP